MFSQRLKELRENKGLEREDLAAALGVSYSAISKYETGAREPDFETLKQLADYFGVSTDYLLDRTSIKNNNTETIAAHRTDDPMADLPPDARKSVEDFIEFVRKQYGTKE